MPIESDDMSDERSTDALPENKTPWATPPPQMSEWYKHLVPRHKTEPLAADLKDVLADREPRRPSRRVRATKTGRKAGGQG